MGTLSAALPRETAFSDHPLLEDQLTRVTLRDLVLPCLNNADTRVSGQGCSFLGLSWHAEVIFYQTLPGLDSIIELNSLVFWDFIDMTLADEACSKQEDS